MEPRVQVSFTPEAIIMAGYKIQDLEPLEDDRSKQNKEVLIEKLKQIQELAADEQSEDDQVA